MRAANDVQTAPTAANDNLEPKPNTAANDNRNATPPAEDRLLTIAEAAERLGITKRGLQLRVYKAQVVERGHVVARLGLGVTAIKINSSWRVRITDVA